MAEESGKPEGRLIFRFDDNGTERAIDPLVAWERLWSDTEVDDVNLVFKRCSQNEIEGVDQLAGLAARMFGLKLVDEDPAAGWTRLELVELFDRFTVMVDAVKKKHGPLPMPLRHLVSKSWGTRGPSTTPRGADSSGSPSASTPAEPTGPSEPLKAPSDEPLAVEQ